jgi:O-methyltransferase
MFLLKIFKRFTVFQNLAGTLISWISPMIEHNIGKYIAIKKAFYLTALEKIEGDYLEFGVFTGGAFVFATKANKRMKWINHQDTRFFGFDSFQGFGEMETTDQHPFYKDDTFAVNFDKVRKNILNQTKGNEVHLIKGYFNETLDGHKPTEYGIKKAKIIFIDCDLKGPARSALSFCKDLIQEGTILIMDDYFSYKGNSDLGISGAFKEFQIENPNYEWRRLFHYGYLGQTFICSSTQTNAMAETGATKNKNLFQPTV